MKRSDQGLLSRQYDRIPLREVGFVEKDSRSSWKFVSKNCFASSLHSAAKRSTGVYFRDHELSKPAHPLQLVETGPPTLSTCFCGGSKKYHVPPKGKPLSPAPVLGHFTLCPKKVGRHCIKSPVKVGKTHLKRFPSHLKAARELTSISLNSEEVLFVEAAASLLQGRTTPSANVQLETSQAS